MNDLAVKVTVTDHLNSLIRKWGTNSAPFYKALADIANRIDNNRNDGLVHASGILDPNFCVRAGFYVVQGHKVPPVYNVRTSLYQIYLRGWTVHLQWQALFQAYGDPISLEKSFKNKYFSYTPDAIIRIKDVEYVVEIKSQNDRNFDNVKFSQVPSENYMRQIQLYMSLSKIKNGFILYDCKSNGAFEVLPVVADESLIERELAALARLKKSCTADWYDLPTRHEECTGPTSKMAEGCIFKKACYPNAELEVENAKS